MSNKIKKLICSLLAATMVAGSASMLVFAEGEDTAASDPAATTENAEATPAPDAEATAAPEGEATAAPEEEATAAPEAEATEAPEAEEAPAPEADAPTSTVYDSDAYYQKSLALCSSLGVISGFEDGSVKPDEKVTRAQMASIVLRLLNVGASTYQNIFTDVQSGHWAADQIQAAYEAGIVNGMGDGTFAPDAEVTYAQVIVMLVNALNFKTEAEMYGGWQQGYIKIAGDKDILKSAQSTADEPADRGLVIKMVYNSLLADYNRPSSYENGSVQYSTDKTLAEDKFDVIEAKGLLIGTSKTSIGSTELDEGQIEIRKDKEDDSEVYDTLLTDLDDCIARQITFYYRENSGRTPEVLAVTYDASKSETYAIDSEDIDTVDFDGSILSVKEKKVSKARTTTADAKYIYNGKIIDASDVTEDTFMPEKGTVTFVKSDKSAVNDYDVVFVDAYETLVVSSASNEKINAKRQSTREDAELGDLEDVTFIVDDEIDRTVTIKKDGEDIKPRNLKKNDVMTVKSSSPIVRSGSSEKIEVNPEVLDIVVTGKSITGSVTSMSKDWDETTATIGGEVYDVANLAVGDLKTGSQGTYYFDQFDRIGYIEASTTGLLASGEKYGWIMNQYKAEGSSDQVVTIMTQEGPIEAKYASNVDYWGPSDTEARMVSRAEISEEVGNLVENGSFTKAGDFQVRLVKFKSNSSNSISKLYCAVDASVVEDEDALRINAGNLKGIAVTSGLVGGYKIADGMLEISVPKSAEDMKDEDNYKFGEVTSGSYVVRENGSTRDFTVGEFKGSTPNILINYVASADALATLDDVDTAGNNPTMIVDKISTGVDEDDNPIYIISGYSAGAETKVTTTKNTVVGKLTPGNGKDAYINSSRHFVTTPLWDAQQKDASLTDFISEGDLLLCSGGERIIQLLDADDVYNVVVTGTTAPTNLLFGGFGQYIARNMMEFGPVSEQPDTDDGAVIMLDLLSYTPAQGSYGSATEKLSFDVSTTMDTVEINTRTGKAQIASEASEVFDVTPFDAASKTGDYVFARFADKGGLQEMVVYRFVD